MKCGAFFFSFFLFLVNSTVDISFAPGIGKRLDGWPNRDSNVGAIISLTHNALPIANMLKVEEATLRTVLGEWGHGQVCCRFVYGWKGASS